MNRIPTITRNLLILNVLLFLLTEVLRGMAVFPAGAVDLNDVMGLHFFMAPDFHFYQLFTYMFMHGGWMHLFFNMFALWMFGCVVENVWGPKKFLFYYIVCGLGAGLFQEVAQFVTYAVQGLAAYDSAVIDGIRIPMAAYLNEWTTVGASGSIYGILLAFGMIFPEQRIFIFPLPVPIKAKWFVVLYAAIELFSALGVAHDNVAHIAHLGGMVVGFFLIRYWQKHPTAGYGTMRGSQFFAQMRSNWEKRQGTTTRTQGPTYHDNNVDWTYNAQQKARQEEIDRILEKIKRSGYDSLTTEEKQKLFDSSRK